MVVSTDAIQRAVLAGVSVTLFVVGTEVLFSSNIFLLFLSTTAVVSFAVLTTIINHVRMLIAVRAHRNQVLGVATKSHNSKTREESNLPHDNFDRCFSDLPGSFISTKSVSIFVCSTVSLLVSMDLVIRFDKLFR